MNKIVSIFILSSVLSSCGNPSVYYGRGPRGEIGDTGNSGGDGSDGFSSLINTVRYETGLALCESDAGVEISNGLDMNRDGSLELIETTTVSVVCDGLVGESGAQGESGQDAVLPPYIVVEVIDPCSKQSAYDEVLLKMADGSLLAHFSNGNLQFLTLIGNGSYQTTDGTGCFFSVNNGNVSW